MLVVDVHALEPIDLLNLIHEVALERLFTQDAEDVVRIARAVHQRLARSDPIAFLHVHMDAPRQQVFSRLGTRLVRHDDDLAKSLRNAAVAHDAVDLADDRRFPRFARLEQFHDARQSAGDVLGLGRLPGNLRQDVAREDFLAVDDHQVRVRRHVVLPTHLAVLVANLDGRLLLLVRRVDDDQP